MESVPAALTPLAGLLTAAALVAPVEYWRARRQLQRWARVRGWQHSRNGHDRSDLVRHLPLDRSTIRIGTLVTGRFAGLPAVAVHMSAEPSGPIRDGASRRRRNRRRYIVVAVQTPTVPPEPGAPGGRRHVRSTAILQDGWLIAWAPTRRPIDTIMDLLPATARAARNLSRKAVTAV